MPEAKRLVNRPLPSDKCTYFSAECIHEAHTCVTRSVHWLCYKHYDVWLTAVIVSFIINSNTKVGFIKGLFKNSKALYTYKKLTMNNIKAWLYIYTYNTQC